MSGYILAAENDALWRALTLRRQSEAAELTASQWCSMRQIPLGYVPGFAAQEAATSTFGTDAVNAAQGAFLVKAARQHEPQQRS